MRRREEGLSIISIVVTIAIGGMVAAGASMTALQVIMGTERNENQARVIQQAHNLGRWFSRDALASENISCNDNPDTGDDEFISLYWEDWQSGETYDIYYILIDDNDSLKRVERKRIKHNIDGAVTENTTTMIADSVYSANISQQENTWILNIETRWGERSSIQEYKITRRLT
jgi:Tfp pilus assembly protein PilE